MKILALDVAASTGWAHSEGDDVTMVYGLWKLYGDHGAKLRQLYGFVRESIDRYETEIIAVEASFFHQKHRANAVKKIQQLAPIQMVGSVMRIPVKEYAPATIKKFITGNGQASKSEVMDALARRYGMDITDDNVADAIGVLKVAESGMTDLNERQALRRAKKQKKESHVEQSRN